jgi:hypothetical protein
MRHWLAALGLAALLALTIVPGSPGAQPTLQGRQPAPQGTMPDPFRQPAPQGTMPDPFRQPAPQGTMPNPFAPAASQPAARTEAPRRIVRRVRPAHHVVRSTQNQPKIAENQRKIAEREGYKRVSDLVNFPKFFPSLGILFVKPDTLPLGPFLCFDRKDRLMATVYMVSIKDIDDHKAFEAPALAGATDHVNIYFNPGHPGVDVPHYHVVIWHVTRKEEERVAN